MTLNPEWKHRVENWLRELPNLFYQPLGPIALSGFVTLEQLTPEQAVEHAFGPMPCGTAWGAKWEYAWFKGEFVLPEAAAGQRIVLRLDVGSEALVFVDGEAAGAKDREHTAITLAMQGQPGQRYTSSPRPTRGTVRWWSAKGRSHAAARASPNRRRHRPR